MGKYKEQMQHENKAVMCKIFVVSGKGAVILGLPDVDLVDLLSVTCDTIDA